VSSSNIPSAPVVIDNTALIADIVSQVNANTNAKATATQAAVVADGDVTQATLDAMTVVDGQLDNNVTAINNKTVSEADRVLANIEPSGGVRLAPNLTFPTDKSSSVNYQRITGINAVGSLTTVLNLTGKFAIPFLELRDIANENVTIKLTIDGVVIWNAADDIFNNWIPLIGVQNNTATIASSEVVLCESSFKLEVKTTSDSSISCSFIARPII